MASQAFALPPRGDESDGLWLLSFDGGGVRGLSTLYILRNIMARLNQARKEMEPPLPAVKPCDVFDLIGGTSTGGFVSQTGQVQSFHTDKQQDHCYHVRQARDGRAALH